MKKCSQRLSSLANNTSNTNNKLMRQEESISRDLLKKESKPTLGRDSSSTRLKESSPTLDQMCKTLTELVNFLIKLINNGVQRELRAASRKRKKGNQKQVLSNDQTQHHALWLQEPGQNHSSSLLSAGAVS